jgi:cytochrome P450
VSCRRPVRATPSCGRSRRNTAPGRDLISALIAAEEQGQQLTTDEINATLRLLFVAGYENAVSLIGHGVLALLRHPDHLAFGTGIHACLGGPLARMQAEIASTTLARRLAGPRLETDPPRYRTDVVRSLETRHVTASAIHPAAARVVHS